MSQLITAQVLAQTLGIPLEAIEKLTREQQIPCQRNTAGDCLYKIEEVKTNLARLREAEAKYKPSLLTWRDYLEIPEEPGVRYQVLAGLLVKDPSPSMLHQWVQIELALALKEYLRNARAGGQIFTAPLDLLLGEFTVVQPDILYLKDLEAPCSPGPTTEIPYLVVEIISPGREERDRQQKRQLYQQAGIQHFWLVSPEERLVECLSLRDEIYQLQSLARDMETLTHPDFPTLQVSLPLLWGVKS